MPATGGAATVELDRPWDGFNPNTPAGAASTTPTLLSAVLPSAYVINPKLVPQVNTDLLLSVEATSTSPLTIQYVINPDGRLVRRGAGDARTTSSTPGSPSGGTGSTSTASPTRWRPRWATGTWPR